MYGIHINAENWGMCSSNWSMRSDRSVFTNRCANSLKVFPMVMNNYDSNLIDIVLSVFIASVFTTIIVLESIKTNMKLVCLYILIKQVYGSYLNCVLKQCVFIYSWHSLTSERWRRRWRWWWSRCYFRSTWFPNRNGNWNICDRICAKRVNPARRRCLII